MKRRAKPQVRPPAPGLGARTEDAYQLRFTPDAAHDIQSLEGSVRSQLRKVLENKLAINPEGYGLPLRGSLASFWKHEFARHRVSHGICPQIPAGALSPVGCATQG